MWSTGRLSRVGGIALVALIVIGCSSDESESPLVPPEIPEIDTPGMSVVGKNCHADPIGGAGSETKFRSVYVDIYSDGSESVTAEMITDTACP